MLGYVDFVSRSSIAGWAADQELPSREVEVGILVDGRPHGQAIANQQRDQLRLVFPGATGQYGFRFEFEWPLNVFESHEVEVVVRGSGELLPNGCHTIPKIGVGQAPRPRRAAGMKPILVTSTGRAGSSLCMARLGSHPRLVVGGDYPYETLLLSYYALALRTLTSQADRARSMNPDAMLGPQFRFQVGYNPFNYVNAGQPPALREYWNNHVPHLLAGTFSRLISDYYRAASKSTGKLRVKFFAEKAQPNPIVRQATQVMFGDIREIVLIRDPRDLLCSYKAFWKAPAEASVERIYSQLEALGSLRNKHLPEAVFIRYEDMILEPDATMSRIWSFIGLDSPEPSADLSEEAMFERHGTSGSPEQSIGRWRNDLSTEEIQICRKKFGKFLEVFGYDP